MSMANETIFLNDKTGLEIDFISIKYKDGCTGPSWLTAHISASEVRSLCGKPPKGNFSVTEDELEIGLMEWLDSHIKVPVVEFRWMWDTYRDVTAA